MPHVAQRQGKRLGELCWGNRSCLRDQCPPRPGRPSSGAALRDVGWSELGWGALGSPCSRHPISRDLISGILSSCLLRGMCNGEQVWVVRGCPKVQKGHKGWIPQPFPSLLSETACCRNGVAICAPTLLKIRVWVDICVLAPLVQRNIWWWSWFSGVLSTGWKNGGKKTKKREESRYFAGLRETREQVGSCLQGWPVAERWQRKLAQQLLTSAFSKQVMKTSCCLDSHSIFSLSRGRRLRRSLLPHHHPFNRKVSGNLTSQLLNLDSPKQHPGWRRKGDQKSCSPNFHESSPLRENLGRALPR